MTGGPLVSGKQANAADVTARKENTASYIIWDDGTNYHGDSMIGSSDSTNTDFGAVFNAVHAQLPIQNISTNLPGVSPQAGTILIRTSPRTYKYSTTPLVTKS